MTTHCLLSNSLHKTFYSLSLHPFNLIFLFHPTMQLCFYPSLSIFSLFPRFSAENIISMKSITKQ